MNIQTVSNKKLFWTTLTSALLAVSCFPPCFFTPLSWFCLVPMLLVIPHTTTKQLLWSHFVFVFFFFCPGLYWMASVHPICPFLMVLPLYIMCLPFPLFYRTIRRSQLRVPTFLLITILWTAQDYLRSFLFSGFPYLFLGHSHAFNSSFIQVADIAGVYGVTFVVVLVNGCLVELMELKLAKTKKWQTPVLIATISTVLVLAGTFIYGNYKLKTITFQYGPKIATIQGNIPQDLKENLRDNTNRIWNTYTTLTLEAMKEKPDLVVWPETMAPDDPLADPTTWSILNNISKNAKQPLFIGAHYQDLRFDEHRNNIYNSVYLFDDQGKIQDRYDKVRIVPLGEYIPMRAIFPFIPRIVENIAGFVPDLSSGEKRVVFTVPKTEKKFGTMICYDVAFTEEARILARSGCDFIVNVTNEGWFEHTAELEQLLTMSIFRAVETRLGILRSGNTGITLNIPPTGVLDPKQILTKPIDEYFDSLQPYVQERIANKSTIALHQLPQALWNSSIPLITKLKDNWDIELEGKKLKWKDFPGYFCHQVPLKADQGISFYAKYGDLFSQLMMLLSIIFFVLSYRKTSQVTS